MVTADQATANRINQAAAEKVASLQTTLQVQAVPAASLF